MLFPVFFLFVLLFCPYYCLTSGAATRGKVEDSI